MQAALPVSDDMEIVERDHAALTAMLDAALARAGKAPRNDLLIDYGLPRATSDADVLAKAGATYWSADKSYLQQCWGPVDVTARQVAGHPEGESVTEPPGSLVCSARLP